MRVILTRHGETEENKAGITQGHLPGKLSELGKEQARKVAERLKHDKIDAIYSSDLARAADTAREITKNHPNIPFHLTEELRERFLGEYQGIEKSLQKHIIDDNVETTESLFTRADAFIHTLLEDHAQDVVLLVCHNGIGKALFAAMTGKEPKNIKDLEKLDNTSITILNINEDRNHKIILHNCTEHL